MGRTVTLDGGLEFTGVPDNVTDEQVRARAIRDGAIPDPGNGMDQFLIGAGKWFADRSGGRIPNDVAAPDGMAAMAGGMAVPVVASLMGPARVAAQAGIAGTMERFRSGSTWGSTAEQAGLGGVLTGAGNMAGRLLGGMQAMRAARRGQVPLTARLKGGLEDVLARTTASAGGFEPATAINNGILNSSARQAMGLPGSIEPLTDDVFAAARQGIGQVYDTAKPSTPVDVSAAITALEEIPKEASPAVNDVLKMLKGVKGPVEPLGWQRAHSNLREARPAVARSLYATWAPKIDEVIGHLDEAGVAGGGDSGALKVANQRYKVLSNLEDINSLVETGQVPAGETFRKLGKRGWHGFGKQAAAEGSTRGLLPETAQLIQVSKLLAAEGRKLAAGSPTAGRLGLFGPAAAAGVGLISGQMDPKTAAGVAALGLAPRVAGAALLSPAVESRAGAAAAQGLSELLTAPSRNNQ